MLGLHHISSWLTSQTITRDLLFTALFMMLTIAIISRGVEAGIERWSKRLMPMLIGLLVLLILYVFTLEGADAGFVAYLTPDMSRIFEPDLVINALGQAFFSLSLGTSVMVIYGSYIPKNENLVTLGAQVTLIDVSIAFLAGLLIIPSMYVAQSQGVAIFSEDGSLISGPNLVFDVLPTLFNSMGVIGFFVAIGFFVLMSIAALTSSISMLEGPVSFAVERYQVARKKATTIVGLGIFMLSTLIILNFEVLFGLVISISTVYGQPLIAMLCCIFVGWIWHRNEVLAEIKQGNDEVEHQLFWKIWPWYTKFVCPSAIAIVFLHSFSFFRDLL